MKFRYEPTYTLAPETGEPMIVLRPEIDVRVFGPKGSGIFRALIDTGADNTVLPKSVADVCGIITDSGIGPSMETFGGHKLPTRFGNVTLEIAEGGEKVRWETRVQFFDFDTPDSETLIMGHAGMLDYFSAEFDGWNAELTLKANDDLPHVDE
jgi:hypothetical protein